MRRSAKLRDNSQLHTRTAIDKQRATIKGVNHWNWQGGKTEKDIALRNSWEYKQWRKAVYERDNYTCQICKVRGGKLCADHIKPWCRFPDLRFELSNGRTLCRQCHYATPTFGYKAIKNSA